MQAKAEFCVFQSSFHSLLQWIIDKAIYAEFSFIFEEGWQNGKFTHFSVT